MLKGINESLKELDYLAIKIGNADKRITQNATEEGKRFINTNGEIVKIKSQLGQMAKKI